MYAKAAEAAGKSFERIRGWISQYRMGHSERRDLSDKERIRTAGLDTVGQLHPEFFQYSRSNSEPTGFTGATDDAERGRNGPLPNRGMASFQNESTEQALAQGIKYSNIYIEEEILTTYKGSAEIKRTEGYVVSNEAARSLFSLTTTEMSADSASIADNICKTTRGNSDIAECTHVDVNGFRNRSQTLDSMMMRPVKNKRCARPICSSRKYSQAKENEESVIVSGLHGNIGFRERTVSVRSITKCHQAIVAEEGPKVPSARHFSVSIEEGVVQSCEEHSLEMFEESIDEEAENGVMSDDNQKTPQRFMSQVMSSRGPITGTVKLCLQHFEASKVLRVILMSATDLKAKKSYVYGKLSAQFIAPLSNKKKVKKLTKQKASSEVSFNEQVYFNNIDEDDMERLTLSARLYNREGVFRSKRCLGEMVIPLFKYDLSMDTNVRGNLRQQRVELKQKNFDEDDDLEVISEDRSIAACVAATLMKSNVAESPRFKEMGTGAGKQSNRD